MLDTDQGVVRPLPGINNDTRFFWTGGENNELLIFRCEDCQYYIHPPVRFCPKCESRNVEPSATSGKGVVTSFTINHKQWMPYLKVPYVVALVSIAEQEDVRLVSNIVHCDLDDVHIGMRVKVLFEQNEDLWVPLFEPDVTV
ncbi:Zn-ribbon domain-containing OB-fold protein [Spongiibacter thalassae]|uniref:Zn-ribbon domain-containing OB-fold protein n=1 Tax=Spongiibacter thalassae TaxID=2721624 RepID=UPI001B2FF50E|nr:OB-fold domain-containing protein [Spongiibacter thalassae]